MQSAVALVHWHVICVTIDLTGTERYTIRVSTNNSSHIAMNCFGIEKTFLPAIISHYNIPRHAISVVNKQICQSGSVWNESGVNSIRTDAVSLEWIPAEMGKHGAIGRGTCNCSEQQYKGEPGHLAPFKTLDCDVLIATGLAHRYTSRWPSCDFAVRLRREVAKRSGAQVEWKLK